MPTNQPSNAPDQVATDAGEDLTAANVLHDERMDEAPGGGGLLGQSAAEGATPANPAAPAVAGDDASLRAAKDAQHLSIDGGA